MCSLRLDLPHWHQNTYFSHFSILGTVSEIGFSQHWNGWIVCLHTRRQANHDTISLKLFFTQSRSDAGFLRCLSKNRHSKHLNRWIKKQICLWRLRLSWCFRMALAEYVLTCFVCSLNDDWFEVFSDLLLFSSFPFLKKNYPRLAPRQLFYSLDFSRFLQLNLSFTNFLASS